MNSKHLLAHMENYKVQRVSADGLEGIAVLDSLGTPANLTAILFDADGMPVAGKIVLQGAVPRRDLSALLEGRTGDLAKGLSLSGTLDFFGLRGSRPTFSEACADAFLITEEGRGMNRDAVADAATALLRSQGITEIAPRLSAEALEALSCVGSFSRAAYAFYADTGDKGEIRRQAAAAYPLLAGEIAAKVLVKIAVDQRKPLAETLMKSFGYDENGDPRMSKGLLKKIANRPLSDGGIPLQTIVTALSEIPVEWFPRDDAEWQAFLDITASFFRRLAPEMAVRAGDLAAGASGRWAEFGARLAKSYANTLPPDGLTELEKQNWHPDIDVSRPAMMTAADGAVDVIHAFRNLVVLPVAAHAGAAAGVDVLVGPEQLRMASDIAATLLFGGKSLSAILDLQRHWHTQAHNMVAATAPKLALKEVAADGWAPLCDEIVAPNGVLIVPLTDPRELENEGAGGPGEPGPDSNGIWGLGHCVGGYSASCRNGTAHIVSFRVPGVDGAPFKRLSTAEFRAISPDSTTLDSRQHRGVRNGAPPQEATDAYNWFVREVAEQRIAINYDGVMRYLAGRRKVAVEVDAYCGYDWRDVEALADAVAPWRPYMPKRLRDATLDDLQAIAELKELIQAIAPTYGYRAAI